MAHQCPVPREGTAATHVTIITTVTAVTAVIDPE